MALACVLMGSTAWAAGPVGFPAATITHAPDLNQRIVLSGNTRPEARAENDRGAVEDSMPLPHLQLQLKRSPEREAALTRYLADLQDSGSPNYHQWLTAEQFAAHFGVASSDLAAVTSWLTGRGFTINGITPSGLNIDFTATAGQIRAAFGTEIHRLIVDGVAHIANMSDPQIPAALASAVAGVVALHDFQPTPHFKPRMANPMYTYTGYPNNTLTAVTPGDLATIYNLKPLFAAGITGLGQTIMVLEDSYVYTVDDFTVFRKTFGLTRSYPHGSLTQVSPQGAMTCTNPGYQGPGTPGFGSDDESILDVEWASAAAPNASIVLAACTATSGIFGGLIALQNVLDGPTANLPSVVSISWGQAESINGATYNLSLLNAYQQAVAEGVSIFVSAGDKDAASADAGNLGPAYGGITISGFASTPYDVAVGGTDFGFNANRIAPSTYFSATNSNTYASALSYVQEIPWNDSCASALIAGYYGMTPLAFCNNAGTNYGSFPNVGGSGGPSGCASGIPSSEANAVSGTCAGYDKPSWQSVYGNPADGVRDIPDVSLFAANGNWGSYYVVCLSNPVYYARCSGAPSTWYGGGGTSFSSPIMAGIQALVNQYTGSRWGNPNINYYYMARLEYGATGSASCNSNTVDKFSNHCVFYDITQGDNAAACLGYTDDGVVFYYNNCYTSSQYVSSPYGFPISVGVLSTSNTAYQPAYSATTGWDFSTGIGSVNAYNLVMHWASPPAAAPR